jgi:Spy/CpxP family protein refolding chaperone
MKRILIIAAVFSLVAAPAMAQVSDMEELLRTVFRSEKKVVFAENMWLTDEESTAFWPIYNDYEAKLTRINDKVAKILREYAATFDTLTDAQAKAMVEEIFDIREQKLKLRKSYAKKFAKVIPEKKVFRFFQLEYAIEALLNFSIASNLPYME